MKGRPATEMVLTDGSSPLRNLPPAVFHMRECFSFKNTGKLIRWTEAMWLHISLYMFWLYAQEIVKMYVYIQRYIMLSGRMES